MNKKSIVIDREYGSGGREVARILSEKLGMEFYDGNLLVLAGKEYGIDLGTLQTWAACCTICPWCATAALATPSTAVP